MPATSNEFAVVAPRKRDVWMPPRPYEAVYVAGDTCPCLLRATCQSPVCRGDWTKSDCPGSRRGA